MGPYLNEVLSIRAQEFCIEGVLKAPVRDLNEVLSIRAQEYATFDMDSTMVGVTSMKS